MPKKRPREIRSGRSIMRKQKRSKGDYRISSTGLEATEYMALDIQLNSHRWSLLQEPSVDLKNTSSMALTDIKMLLIILTSLRFKRKFVNMRRR